MDFYKQFGVGPKIWAHNQALVLADKYGLKYEKGFVFTAKSINTQQSDSCIFNS